ncbi:MAG: murein biosynthesis integral membrane protein MurJ [Anaerolineales bacterium]|jgi:putative peptidoglycan lipid II flippase
MSHIARSTLIIAVFFGLEKILGFVRQVIIARTFGLSAELDAFNAANNIPDLLFALISSGALAIAFIPVLSEYMEKRGRKAAWNLFSRIANLLFLVTAVISVVIALLANQLVGWGLGIAPGFDAAQQSLVAELMRLNLIATLFFSLAGLVIGGLQANQHFLLPALAPSMYDVGTLFGVLILVPKTGYQLGPITLPAFGMGIHGLVYGVILGAFLFFVVQIPGLLHYKFRWIPAINLRHPGVRQVINLIGPRILTVFFTQLVFLAQDNLASRLIAGSVTALVYGWLIMQVPESLIGTAIGTALLPTISEQIAREDRSAFHRSINKTLRVILALTIPSTTLLAVTITPVVKLLGFDNPGTELVVWTARAYLLGLAGHALLEVAARAYYAQQDARTPLLTKALTAVLFIALGILFAPRFGAPGIGLANSLAFTGEAFLLLILLNRSYPELLRVRSTLLRVGLATIGSTGGVYFLLQWLPVGNTSPLIAVLVAGGGLTLGAVVLLPFIWSELRILVRL